MEGAQTMSVTIMIVDDSPFSRTILAETMRENGYEVVGEAESLENLLETYSGCKPDLVTMDIAMPGADGFECSKALLAHDPEAKIIMVSSMMDDDTVAEAKRIGVVGYVQKPVEAEAIKRIIENVMAPDSLFESLKGLGLDIFKEALSQNMTRMTKASTTFAGEEIRSDQFISQGITVVIGVIGRYSGSMILDFSEETAEKMAEAILHRKVKNHDEVLSMGAEFSNVVAGVACSMLNKKEKSFGLRVAPPNVFYGSPSEVIRPKLYVRSIYSETDYGRLYLSIGFKKESVIWM